MIFFCVGVVYSGEYDVCDVTLSVYPHRACLKNMPGHRWESNLRPLEYRAQYNGRSTDNDRPKLPLDRSLFHLTGHFDRPHFHTFP
jgi:hypothetical protein